MRIIFLLFSFCVFSSAQMFSLSSNDSSKAELLSEVKSIEPGQRFAVALALTHPPHWHSYYRNPGGIELPPTIAWKLPEGFQAGEIQWPAPQVTDPTFQLDESAPEKSYTYADDQAFLIVEITAPDDRSWIGKSITLEAKAQWQICWKSCKNEQAKLSLTLPVVEKSEIDPAIAPRFVAARAHHPQSSALSFTAMKDGETIQLIITGVHDMRDAHFIADQNMIVPAASMSAQSAENGSVIRLQTRREMFSGTPTEISSSISGILRFRDAEGEQVIRVPQTPITQAPTPPMPMAAFLRVLLGMFLGGLVLNLMPCVFPVIGIKILGFVQQSGQDQRKIVLHGITFTVGVLVSFAVLSVILFVARQAAGGEALGWGYQLQNPHVVAGLMILMFVMALNLFGVFEMGTSVTGIGGKWQQQQGLMGSFFSGFLATVVATPCSGPLLGAAIGAAIVLPALQFFSAFGGMALGLATPYLLMSIFPSLVSLLPRPGAWMETFKQGMSFLLFATAGFFLWVYVGLIQFENMLNPIFGLTCVALAAWIYGRWSTPVMSTKVRRSATIIALLIAVVGVTYAVRIKKGLEWEKWSPERVEQALEEGHPVFVDFTAQWCLTCQFNKRQAYSDEVMAVMKERGIVALKADKTQPDPIIEEKLAELKRTAIPVNVYYRPDREPVITPEVLTSSYLLELFRDDSAELQK